jgi:hypothetical protein
MQPNWFVGFPLKAGPWFTGLVADVPSGIRVLHPQDLHLTVAFLGACGQDASALRERPFTLALSTRVFQLNTQSLGMNR